MQLTSKVKSLDFGSLTRLTDEGTETVWVIQIVDEFGSTFKFMLAGLEDYSNEKMETAGERWLDWLDFIGYEDAE